MGWNTSVIILNDCLHDIERDPAFGKKISQAVGQIHGARYEYKKAGRSFHGIDVSAGCSVNAATVIDTNHADDTSVIAFGGNRGINLGVVWAYGTEPEEVRVLKALADKYGYSLRKKPTRA
jgi:hypothetical protein